MEFTFLNPGDLSNGTVRLQLEQTVVDTSGEEALPTYRFHIVREEDSARAGFVNLRIGWGKNLICYRGHLGYGIAPEYQGHGYAAQACRLLVPLVRRHGINPVWITCNPDNLASRRTCEKLGAQLVEIVTVPENTEAYRAGAREKCRYRLDL